MWISRKEIEELSKYLRGELDADIRDNKEGEGNVKMETEKDLKMLPIWL